MIESQWRVERAAVVVVPVHDEALLLDDCLSAIADAMVAAGVPTHLIIVLDACTDASAEIATRWAIDIDATVLTVNRHNVGAARAAGFRVPTHSPGTWFATTDADCEVPVDWLCSQLGHAHSGAHVVAGTVSADFGADFTELKQAYDANYRIRRGLGHGHGHVHGANLGMRADAYWRVGGFAATPTDEDIDLISRFDHAAIPVTYAEDAAVSTSTRRIGRAPAGFSGHLRALERDIASGLAAAL